MVSELLDLCCTQRADDMALRKACWSSGRARLESNGGKKTHPQVLKRELVAEEKLLVQIIRAEAAHAIGDQSLHLETACEIRDWEQIVL